MKNKTATRQEIFQQFLKMDIWTQRRVGRECSLHMIKQLKLDMPQYKHTLSLVAGLERLAMKACDSKDQRAYDKAVADSTKLTNIIKDQIDQR
jgi:fatty acid/phospholipid biosynthesis enzyme